MRVRVGIVDSGVAPLPGASIAAAAGFACGVRQSPASDVVGHGTEVAKLILALAPAAEVLSAQVFATGRHADAGSVAEAIGWCLEQEARVLNLSFGVSAGHEQLRAACDAAVVRGVIVVASAPARGAPVYPAAYPGVFAVTGDARCAGGDWSAIEPGALHGAATWAADGVTRGGASFAAARMSGHAARFLAGCPGAGAEDFRRWLAKGAAFHGRERRRREELA